MIMVGMGIFLKCGIKRSNGDKMNLTENEKKVIIEALKRHLKDVKESEGEIGQNIIDFAGETKYEQFVENIIKKLG